MSASVLLFSSHDITEEELAEVILQAGGKLLSPGMRSFGGIIDGEDAVWIDRIDCYDGVFDYEGKPLDDKEFALLEQARILLGGEFQTWIYIAIGHGSGSGRLAVRFAHTCCQHWPCVIDNTHWRLFSCQEIAQLYKEGGTFTGYGL